MNLELSGQNDFLMPSFLVLEFGMAEEFLILLRRLLPQRFSLDTSGYFYEIIPLRFCDGF